MWARLGAEVPLLLSRPVFGLLASPPTQPPSTHSAQCPKHSSSLVSALFSLPQTPFPSLNPRSYWASFPAPSSRKPPDCPIATLPHSHSALVIPL